MHLSTLRISHWFSKLNEEHPSRTGVVYNVTPSAVGVIVYKRVGGRYLEKRVNVRIEHIKHSKCRQEFLDRVKENAAKKRAAKEKGGNVSTSMCIEYIVSSISHNEFYVYREGFP